MKVLVTGAAGFIGFYTCRRLAERGDQVVGLDSINSYYDVRLKYGRLKELGVSGPENGDFDWNVIMQSSVYRNLRFVRMSLEDKDKLPELFSREKFDGVINLAAQAGVRYSIENPFAYIDSNLVGFANILECCRHNGVNHLVYASSSSVYGGNTKTPFCESDIVDSPVSLYAATKKANELMASCYCKLYGMKATGLRFFTVYGPWGRPDMAPMLFSKAILNGEPIKVFNNGDMMRDFTYIDDIVEGVIRVLDKTPEPAADGRAHTVYNIGCSNPVRLMDFISTLERSLGLEAKKNFLPMQPGDVYQTYADTAKLEKDMGYKPSVQLKDGLEAMAAWYKSDKNPLK
ncbi:MAG: NAD-dependent epimerase [Bacteroidaceae bacterium]|nr:NAD-dependent epimerase [Bacteroidaceae bacterium]